jgi:cytochrome d ubiquinol oxidase subunit I
MEAAADPLLLGRLQFAANITFHILFPTITIALGWMLLLFRVRWLRTGDAAWLVAYRLWTKVFALSFALGVVSGVTMSFQFGTNWPGFMERVGNVAGPLLGYEVLTAFFLEAAFLGIMLYGGDRVSERTRLVATLLVAVGTTLSAFWILSLNSWMHTPQGHVVRGGEFFVASWAAVVFNPSFPYRLAHVLLASGLTVAFLLAGVSAWQLLRGHGGAAATRVLRVGIVAGAVLIPLQVAVGDLHGLNTLEHQPAKIAAMEGVWTTTRGAPLLLVAWPDPESRSNRFALGIPRGASLILTHAADGEVQGIDAFPDAAPPVRPVFIGFRVMVGTGLVMLVAAWTGVVVGRRHRWDPARLPRWLLRGYAALMFSGWLASVAGWYVTEIGRQPFLVYGLLRTAEAASATPAAWIAGTLAAWLLLYAVLIAAYVSVLLRLAAKADAAPAPGAATPAALPAGAPA